MQARRARPRSTHPVAGEEAEHIYGEREDLKLTASAEDALQNADALAIVTEWNMFRSPDFDKMKALMKNAVIFDGRNIYDPQSLRDKGFAYEGIGRL